MTKWICEEKDCSLAPCRCEMQGAFVPVYCIGLDEKNPFWKMYNTETNYEHPSKQNQKKTLPDWCKCGALAYGEGRYGKITGICHTSGKIDIGETGHFIPVAECAEARLRPYNAEEKKALVGKVVSTKRDCGIITGYRGEDNIVFVALENFRYSAEALLGIGATIDGYPCGVLEHLENGEWEA